MPRPLSRGLLVLLPLAAALVLVAAADRAVERSSYRCGGQVSHSLTQVFGVTVARHDSRSACVGGQGLSRWGWPFATRRQRLEDFPLPLSQQGPHWQTRGLVYDLLLALALCGALTVPLAWALRARARLAVEPAATSGPDDKGRAPTDGDR